MGCCDCCFGNSKEHEIVSSRCANEIKIYLNEGNKEKKEQEIIKEEKQDIKEDQFGFTDLISKVEELEKSNNPNAYIRIKISYNDNKGDGARYSIYLFNREEKNEVSPVFYIKGSNFNHIPEIQINGGCDIIFDEFNKVGQQIKGSLQDFIKSEKKYETDNNNSAYEIFMCNVAVLSLLVEMIIKRQNQEKEAKTNTLFKEGLEKIKQLLIDLKNNNVRTISSKTIQSVIQLLEQDNTKKEVNNKANNFNLNDNKNKKRQKICCCL